MLDESEIDSSVNSILVGVVLVVLEEKGKVCWPTMFGPDIFPFLPQSVETKVAPQETKKGILLELPVFQRL